MSRTPITGQSTPESCQLTDKVGGRGWRDARERPLAARQRECLCWSPANRLLPYQGSLGFHQPLPGVRAVDEAEVRGRPQADDLLDEDALPVVEELPEPVQSDDGGKDPIRFELVQPC